MSHFHNPYAFVPPGKKKPQKRGPHVTHERYVTGRHSGRLVVRLENVGPFMVGAESVAGSPSGQEPYRLNEKLAVPATSLKGMISSLVEALSGSALRMLEDTEYEGYVRRGQKERLGSAHQYFDGILLPIWSEGRTKKLHVAEAMFGFGSDPDPKEGEVQDPGLAGRVRFYTALLHEAVCPDGKHLDDPVTLKIMSSPKPPCPNFYVQPVRFREAPTKKMLCFEEEYRKASGRKYYLHAEHIKEILEHGARVDSTPWVSEYATEKKTLNQKTRITPVRSGRVFYFHIDFDNLSNGELGYLLRALRPSEGFYHKLGLGKPLGLGSIRLDLQGLFLVDRQKRYTDPPGGERYHRAWRNDGKYGAEPWPDFYEREDSIGEAEAVQLEDFREQAKVPEGVQGALEILGNPLQVRYPVHYPPNREGGTEHKLYEWFMDNPRQSIGEVKNQIPPLKS